MPRLIEHLSGIQGFDPDASMRRHAFDEPAYLRILRAFVLVYSTSDLALRQQTDVPALSQRASSLSDACAAVGAHGISEAASALVVSCRGELPWDDLLEGARQLEEELSELLVHLRSRLEGL